MAFALPTSKCCSAKSYVDSVDRGLRCTICDSPLNRQGDEVEHPARIYRARDLKIYDNGYGGYPVEFDGEIVAGPYAAKCDAQTAKRELVAGVPLSQWADGHFA